MNIAVTATGGGVGQSIIKSLKQNLKEVVISGGKKLRTPDYKIIAFDSERYAAGLYMADKGYLIPYAASSEYIPELLRICKEEKINYLFPGMDCELMKLSQSAYLFEDIGTHVIVSNPDVITIADDKLKTQEFLKSIGLPHIKTVVNCDGWEKFPCGKVVVKPKNGGARSKGVKVHKNISEIDYNLDGMVVQEFIEGDEYTCGTLTLNGKYRGCIVMRRILRDGDTYKAFVEENQVIENLCRKVCEELKPFGALNIQLRLRDGVPYVFEFNARCSGTTAARSLAGFNEPKMIVDYLTGKEPQFSLKKTNILRYWNELVVNELI